MVSELLPVHNGPFDLPHFLLPFSEWAQQFAGGQSQRRVPTLTDIIFLEKDKLVPS